MTNEEVIRSMNTKQLAQFINIPYLACNELCPDAESGCAWTCQHNQGLDIIEEWLKQEADDI